MSTALAVHHGLFGRVALYSLDRDMVAHAHREGHLIFHLQGPAARVQVEDALLPLAPGSAVAVSPWQLHDFQTLQQAEESLFLILYIRPRWFLEASRQPSATLHFGRSRIEVNETIARMLLRIASHLLEQPGPAGGWPDEGCLAGLLGELTQSCFDQSWQWAPDGRPRPARAARTIRDYRVRNSVRLLQSELGQAGPGERIALDGVARAAGLSRPHFYKLFREQLGITPNTYLNTLRMERAIERLVITPDTVTEIGLDLGFSSQASFTRFFTSNVGITPSNYRQVAQAELA